MQRLESSDSVDGDDDVAEVPRYIRVFGGDETKTQLPSEK